jgi:Putative Actinobacterial Holin-X, holin superfamily III
MTVPPPSHRPAADPYTPPPVAPPAGAYPQGQPTPPTLSADASEDVGDVSLGDLIGNVTRDLSTLLRQELALAQAELKQEATKTAKGGGAMAGAPLAAFFVLLFLSLALWAGLANVMDAGWAALIVALIWAAITAVLFVTGRSRLRRVRPTPERTVETLSQVPDALKGSRGGHA